MRMFTPSMFALTLTFAAGLPAAPAAACQVTSPAAALGLTAASWPAFGGHRAWALRVDQALPLLCTGLVCSAAGASAPGWPLAQRLDPSADHGLQLTMQVTSRRPAYDRVPSAAQQNAQAQVWAVQPKTLMLP